jgi:hypothetical protein
MGDTGKSDKVLKDTEWLKWENYNKQVTWERSGSSSLKMEIET